MSKEIMLVFGEDGVAREYDDTWDITIHCESKEEQDRVWKKLNGEEPKKGKWNFIGDQMFECTECGTCYTQSQFHQMRVRITDSEFPKFCPNCGADMRGEENG